MGGDQLQHPQNSDVGPHRAPGRRDAGTGEPGRQSRQAGGAGRAQLGDDWGEGRRALARSLGSGSGRGAAGPVRHGGKVLVAVRHAGQVGATAAPSK